MLRALHTLVTAVSLLLLVAVAALWIRSPRRTDVFTLRTARSYAGWPDLKWLVLRDFASKLPARKGKLRTSTAPQWASACGHALRATRRV